MGRQGYTSCTFGIIASHAVWRRAGVLLTLGILLLGLSQAAFAVGKFISATSRTDMVYDDARHVLYITNGGTVLRYDTTSNAFLTPFQLGGNLRGIDLSPDGNTLAVANTSYSSTEVWIHLADLNTGQSTKVLFTRDSGEGGTFTVAYGSDGQLLISSAFQGSGWVPLRRYDPSTGTTTILADICQNSMLRASADGSIIGWAEGNISDGRWGRYRVSDGNLVFRQWENGTSRFNYEIAVSRDGSQYGIPTYGGTFIYNSSFAKIGTIGVYASGSPMGVVYHPTMDIVYFPWATTTKVRAYTTTSFTQVGEYDFENTFDHPGNSAFQEGRLKMSRDGNMLFATVAGGVRYIKFNSPPDATSRSVTTPEDKAVNIALTGGDVDGTPLTYTVLTGPAHGALSGTAPNLLYTPEANYNGPDSFTFRISSGGEDSTPATVSITVTPVNDPPVADSQSVTTAEDTPLAVTLGGSDVDKDTLKYYISSSPTHGTLSGTLPNLTYTPAANYNGPDSFTFRVSDNSVYSPVATVSIGVTPVNDPPTTSSQDVLTGEDMPVAIALTGTDIDGDPLTYIVVEGPAHGTLSGLMPNLTYTPAADYNGADSFTFKVSDGVDDSAVATAGITISAINDAPSFTLAGGSMIVKPKERPVVVPGWVQSIRPGPADEAGQALRFVIFCSNPTLFLIQPAVDRAGTLTFVPAKKSKSKGGTVVVTVRACDDGGTANGGVDESGPRSFTIIVK